MPEEVFTEAGEPFATSKMVRDWLRKPFKPEQIGKLPATPKRPALDFVGHAAVTDRLNKIAPDWSYTVDDIALGGDGRKCWIRGTMTIGGVSRPEFGDGDDPKEAIGNFIRRGAMRFGVAIDLWSREELDTSPAAGPAAVSGAAAGEATTASASADAAGDHSSTEGEAVGGEVPGEDLVLSASPGTTIVFPLKPSDCDHKTKTGRWLPARQLGGVPVCPRCGLSAILYRESAA